MTISLGANQRAQRAHIANMRQELLAPAEAIVGYGEMLREEATRIGCTEFVDDLDRIVATAKTLLELVERVLGEDGISAFVGGGDVAEVQKTLRHDLRNPLNAIKGYSEMLLEDLEEPGQAEPLRGDLEKMLAEVTRLLSEIDRIVDFSGVGGDDRSSGSARPDAAMILDLLRDIRPVEDNRPSTAEGGRILVVDDIEANRDLLSRRLARDGHSVVAAAGGLEALQLLAGKDFDLVLLDLMMPDMNGFEVLARLKADDRLHDIPVIMISALDEIDSVVRCIEAGAEDYLAKPFDPVLLRARINACLEKKQWRERENRYLNQLEMERKTSPEHPPAPGHRSSE